jgi:hypothetical protein
VREIVDGAIDSEVGIGVLLPSVMAGRFTAPFGGTVKKADSPNTVAPFWTHVALAFTCPKLAGTFGSTHVPSGATATVRFKTLTVQF